MSKIGRAISLAGAALSGYAAGQDMRKRDEQIAEDRAWQREQRDAQRAEAQRDRQARISLANAATPTQVEEGAGGALRPETMDNRDVGQPGEAPVAPGNNFRAGGKTYADRAQAEAAATEYNSEPAKDSRISLAMAQSGDVKGAKAYQASARQAEVSGMELADKRWGRQIREAVTRGHDGLADFVSRSQGDGLAQYQIKAVPSADGKQVTYHKVNPDGTTTPTQLTFSNDEDGAIRAAYMLDRSITPEKRYSNMVAEDKQTAAMLAKEKDLEIRLGQLKVAEQNAETRAQLAQVQTSLAELRAQRAGAAGGGDGKVSREERLRYTTLFSDAGRRMQDAQKTLTTLSRDPAYQFAKPGSPQQLELQQIRESINTYKAERDLYGGLLAESASGKKPSLGDAETKPGAKPTAQPAQAVKVATKAERDKLPAGTRYVGPDGAVYIKQ